METIIRINLGEILCSGEAVIIELGCGKNCISGRINIDKLNLPNVDVVTDIEGGLPFLPDNSVDEIYSNSFFEHIDDLEGLMREIVRVLKKDGKCFISVPHFSNPYFYSDYTHRKFFGLYTFFYFVEDQNHFRRKVPSFYTDIRIKIQTVKLVFMSPFPRRNWLKKRLELIINSSPFMQEFYEENLSYIFPCYALELIFTPK